MKVRFVVLSCVAVLALFAFVPTLYAADPEVRKSMTYDDYAALPKLEIVTQEIKGNFADTKIEYTSFKQVEGVDRYYLHGYTGKGRASGMQTLVEDYKSVRSEAKKLMARLCGKKKAIVESDLLYPAYFTTQFRCQ